MNANIIRAIINIIVHNDYRLKIISKSKNRVNSVGDSLEEFIKDIFASSINDNDSIRNKKIADSFSYLGNSNNPPDIILKNSDAIEVKKIENLTSDIALNSSYPKAKLYSKSDMITEACRNCESWIEKDIIYAVGVCKGNTLIQLSFVYGIDYSASDEIYSRIKKRIKEGVLSINNIEFADTKELGRVNKVDPLGITYLRIRGMWNIENPLKTFSYVYKRNENANFNFMAIINKDKWKSLPTSDKDELYLLSQKNTNLNIIDTEIKIPDNPAKYKKAKLITFFY